MNDNKVSGPQDTVVSEMIRLLPLEKISTFSKCFQERFIGSMEDPSFWRIVKIGFPEEARCGATKGHQKLQSDCTDFSHVDMVRFLRDDVGRRRPRLGGNCMLEGSME